MKNRRGRRLHVSRFTFYVSFSALLLRLPADLLGLRLQIREPALQSALRRRRLGRSLDAAAAFVVALLFHALGRVHDDLAGLLALLLLLGVVADALGLDDADRRAGQD